MNSSTEHRKIAPDWWVALPVGERVLLHAIAHMLRSARRSQLQEVARAAAKWELGLACFIKVRLIAQNRRSQNKHRILRRACPLATRPSPLTSSPSAVHTQPGASPNPG